MRFSLPIVFLTLTGTIALADPLSEPKPLTADQLKAFSEQTGFGGSIQHFTSGSREIAVVTRSFTSGFRSSDLHVFARHGEVYVLVLHREKLYGSRLEAKQNGDAVRIITDPQKQTILTFTISGCYNSDSAA